MRGGAATLILGAAAGALFAVAIREALLGTPAALAWMTRSIEPLHRAGREGHSPSTPERRRLALIGTGIAVGAGWFVAGLSLALPLAVAGPALAGAAVTRGRRRYRRAVARAVPLIAAAVADSLSAGRSLRGALGAAATSLDGPAGVELARVGAELELGAPTDVCLHDLRARLRSERVDSLVTALLSQRLAGGDLAALLRRFAEGAAERDRVVEDARTATAQARFTGLLVVAMPSGAALFAELIQPGFMSRMLASPAATLMLCLAAALQAAGFLAIRRLSRIE